MIPELNPKLEEFARHYGTVILPTKPGDAPAHKGKVESAVKYAQNNAVKGRTFESLTAQNAYLADWGGKRTWLTRASTAPPADRSASYFEEVERHALQPLPANLFPVFEEAQRTVHRDGYVEFKKAYYSAPHPNTSDARFGCGAGNTASCGFITRVGSRSRCMRWPNQESSPPTPAISTAANATSLNGALTTCWTGAG